ncbi:unnamed protein product [Phytophthora fragariaefolia]|uniref:Unnamed protein product n=1 Tax=Phytophthora fragariaefolia TaxID=1490495 RepID=A0A9W7CMK0_9STRA|nr:unnamed protein product [Phytophthora fragariaefolia]
MSRSHWASNGRSDATAPDDPRPPELPLGLRAHSQVNRDREGGQGERSTPSQSGESENDGITGLKNGTISAASFSEASLEEDGDEEESALPSSLELVSPVCAERRNLEGGRSLAEDSDDDPTTRRRRLRGPDLSGAGDEEEEEAVAADALAVAAESAIVEGRRLRRLGVTST